MPNSNEIEDSLRACREIQDKRSPHGAITDYDGNEPYVRPQPREQIDHILDKYKNPPSGQEDLSFPAAGGDGQEEEPAVSPTKRRKPAETRKRGNTRHPLLRCALAICSCLFTALLLALLITQYVAHHTSVEGSSMETALADGDQIIVEKISYYLHKPERFDIIVFPSKQGINYIKRIIGLPGETVRIADGNILINGRVLEESYGNEPIMDAGLARNQVVLGENEYFVLGDNRNGSIDSRRKEVGKIDGDLIKGKVWFRFYPFSSAGTIK